MLMPIVLAYKANAPLSEAAIRRRLDSILAFLDLADTGQYMAETLADHNCGLIFINYRKPRYAVSLAYARPDKLAASAYLPFGARSMADDASLRNGAWITDALAHLRQNPGNIFALHPPQLLCELNAQAHRLVICNDWRGFGKLYEYQSDFGSIWSNKQAAALIFASRPASLNGAAMADIACFHMISGQDTAYEGVTLAPPGTWIEIDTDTGHERRHRLNNDVFGLESREIPPDAVDETHAAMAGYMADLKSFITDQKLLLNLSGGRDSRVAGSALCKSGLDFEVNFCSPPVKDAEIAEKLLRAASYQGDIKAADRHAQICEWYAIDKNLTDVAENVLSYYNPDVSYKQFLSWPTGFMAGNDYVVVAGHQGEVAHNCNYTPQMFEMWLARQSRTDIDSAAKRLDDLLATLTINSPGVTACAARQGKGNVSKHVLLLADQHGFTDFYKLDFLYLHLFLNRQWAGANGAYDHKTPLTVYPYAKYAFSQPIGAKIESRFIRDVIASFMPAWRDIPFFQELPDQETEDLYASYPTFWRMGRGQELADLCAPGGSQVWNWLDWRALRKLFSAALNDNYYNSLSHRKLGNLNATAQKMLWLLAIESQLQKINSLIEANNRTGFAD